MMGHENHGAVSIEALNPRRLFASFATADYYPLGDGIQWEYSINEDGSLGTAELATRSLQSIDGKPATRFYASIHLPDARTAEEDYRYSPATGIVLVHEEHEDDGDVLTLDPKVPDVFLPPVLKVGSKVDLPPVDLIATLSDGEHSATGSGTRSESIKLEAHQDVVTGTAPSTLRFVDTLRISSSITESVSVKINGDRHTIVNTDVETRWYARGIGLVKVVLNETVTADGEKESHQMSLELASSTLFFFEVNTIEGVLTVNGSNANDRIDLSQTTDSKTRVTVNGVARDYSPAEEQRIRVLGERGNDTVTIGTGVPAVYIDAGAGNDSIVGGDGSDTITGGAGRNTLYGGAGDDRMNGSGGRDLIFGGNGADRIYGNAGNDTLSGGNGVDRLFGGDGDDSLLGGSSNDKLYGEAGRDTLKGDGQDDLLDGGTQVDHAAIDPGDTLISIQHLLA